MADLRFGWTLAHALGKEDRRPEGDDLQALHRLVEGRRTLASRDPRCEVVASSEIFASKAEGLSSVSFSWS